MQRKTGPLVVFTAVLATVMLRQVHAEGFVTQGEETQTLHQRLMKMDALRTGAGTPFVDIEKQGRELLAQYTRPAERAQIFFALAHIYAQSDIRLHPERVTRYARLALTSERDPIQRGILYSYLGSAAEVDPTRLTFAEQREQAARAWLQGYKELLPLHLPAVAPELPTIEKMDYDLLDPAEQEKARRKHENQRKARREAERLRRLVENRNIFVRQLAEVYGREPQANDEIKQLARRVLGDGQAAEALLAQVIKI
jgi:hypothetical protein